MHGMGLVTSMFPPFARHVGAEMQRRVDTAYTGTHHYIHPGGRCRGRQPWAVASQRVPASSPPYRPPENRIYLDDTSAA